MQKNKKKDSISQKSQVVINLFIESVELTPPDQDDPSEFDTIAEVAESFSQFSYNDGTCLSQSSLHSRNSIPLQTGE
jgi:hypothetical protein